MDERTRGATPFLRKIVYAIAALIAVFALAEAIARVVERARDRPRIEFARSPLKFQQIPDAPLVDDVEAFEHDWLINLNDPLALVPKEKAENEKRVVLVGGSWVQGAGVASPATFASIVQRLLREAAPGQRIDVFNLGITGYSSTQHAVVMERIAQTLKPDIVVWLSGNNEFLDFRAMSDRSDAELAGLMHARRLEWRFALVRLFMPRLGDTDPATPESPSAPPRTPGDDVRSFVQERLGRALRRFGVAVGKAGGKLVVCTIPVNERYAWHREWFFTGPAHSQPRAYQVARWALYYDDPDAALAAVEPVTEQRDPAAMHVKALALDAAGRAGEARAAWRDVLLWTAPETQGAGATDEAIYLAAAAMSRVRGPEAVGKWLDTHLERVKDIDFLYASLLEFAGRFGKAREVFSRMPTYNAIHADPGINRTLVKTASRMGADVFDLAAEVRSRSINEIIGWEYFLDYCHLNPRGHILVAHLLARDLADRLDLPGSVPAPEPALAKERHLRRGLTRDLADLRWWTGADFDATRLVDEIIEQGREPVDELAESVAARSAPALARVFTGNWRAAHEWALAREKVGELSEIYREALALDPNVEGARENIAYLEEIGKRK
ncbi:SGNH/GDSL hydrolase family protein [bacterium]|nr:SGNH/GDSL hydrolase family protein [bacterium]